MSPAVGREREARRRAHQISKSRSALAIDLEHDAITIGHATGELEAYPRAAALELLHEAASNPREGQMDHAAIAESELDRASVPGHADDGPRNAAPRERRRDED